MRAALTAGAPVRELFLASDLEETARDEFETDAARVGIAVHACSTHVIKALSETKTPQGVVAVVEAATTSLQDLPAGLDLAVVLAEVRDPGNAGTLLRSAAAAGAGAVVFTRGSVDPLGPKTVRASAGALFEVRVVRDVSLEDAAGALRERGLALLGTDAAAPMPIDEVDLVRPLALVLGNEAWGYAEGWREVLDEVVAIPMPGHVESLNVGIAGSIVLFEAVRQRRRNAAV